MSDTADFRVDTTRLEKLIASLTPRRPAALLRSAMRRPARDIKKRAEAIMLSGVGHVRDRRALRKGIWTRVYKRTPGFQVTVASRKPGDVNHYPSRMRSGAGARMLPVALWLEGGTADRVTRKGGYARGGLRAIGFLTQAKQETEASTVRRIEEETVKRLEKLAQRYG